MVSFNEIQGLKVSDLETIAFQEPYVLAFEPSFVEIRDINTGRLSQVIQGSNLRLLFADNPPSVTNNPPVSQQYNTYQPGYDFNPHVSPPTSANSYGSRSSAHSGYGPPPAHMQNPSQYPRSSQGFGRDEILMVSDDRVLALRPAFAQQRFMPDNVSMRSIPR